MRIREANNPGPRHHRRRLLSSSEDECLVPNDDGRDVIPRMEQTGIDPGSNRFAALADAETVPAGTQELEEAGVVRDGSSSVWDQDRVPESILDALQLDLVRPSRRFDVGGWGPRPGIVGIRCHTVGEWSSILIFHEAFGVSEPV